MIRQRGAVDLAALMCVVLTLSGFGAGIYAWILQGEGALLERQLAQSEKDLKTVVALRDDLRDINASGGAVKENEEGMIQTFFAKTAEEHKFTISKFSPASTRYKETWTEQSYKLDIKNVSRQQLGNFIADVELKKPCLKSKEIRDVKFDESHAIQNVAVIFSHYQRIRK